MARNARFWVWHRGGWVKLTIRPGQEVTFVDNRPTEEGWLHHQERYAHDGESVVNEWVHQERDCDGRHESGGELVCPLADLRAVDAFERCDMSANRGIMAPDWKRVGSHQRDHTAEAAGY